MTLNKLTIFYNIGGIYVGDKTLMAEFKLLKFFTSMNLNFRN